jgi:hypothetical protein
MRSYFGRIAALFLWMAICIPAPAIHGQEAHSALPTVVDPSPPPSAITDAPEPQIEPALFDGEAIEAQSQQPATGSQSATTNTSPQSPQTPAQPVNLPATTSGASQSSSSSQSSAQQAAGQETQHQKAEEQLKEQEHQRVAGIMATFNTTRNPDALPLSSGQKFHLFFKSALDPWPFGLSAVVAGINQAANADPEWGQGVRGYAKRFGAGYSDYFIGNFFGNAVLPSVLHEDPRYFQKGSGSYMGRFFWAAGSTVWCKRDRGTWGPNWANVGGNLIGAAIARTYYPASERTVSDTITDGLTVSAEGIVGAEVIEFWPDIVRHHRRKQAEKQARAKVAADKQQNQPKSQN